MNDKNIINTIKSRKNLGKFEFVRSVVVIGNLFHCFILFCSEESSQNLGRHDRDANLPSIVSRNIIHFVGKLLMHS